MSIANLFEVELTADEDEPPGYGATYGRVGPQVGSEQLGLSVYELEPGLSIFPTTTRTRKGVADCPRRPAHARTAAGDPSSGPWDCAFFPTGEEGAHKVTHAPTRRFASLLVEQDRRCDVGLPDSEKVGAWPPGKLFRLADAVDYFTARREQRQHGLARAADGPQGLGRAHCSEDRLAHSSATATQDRRLRDPARPLFSHELDDLPRPNKRTGFLTSIGELWRRRRTRGDSPRR